ncbi:MAG: glycosyltransferase family 2 protein, partial [Nitrospinae bacterium]|nr:glycosyltransferase family 2 protein [Nitrospinota bacterium]
MPKNKPLVSVVIPAYNGAKYIKEAIESVLLQSYKKLEVLVCDDASTDNTGEIVQSIQDERLNYLRFEKNTGLSGNLNRGIKKARGEYVCWFNQDDIFLQDKVQFQVEEFQKDPNVGAVFCQKQDIDVNGNILNLINPSLIPFKN